MMGQLGMGLDALGDGLGVDRRDLVEGDHEVLSGDQVQLVQPGRLTLDRRLGPISHQQQVLLVLVDLGSLVLVAAVLQSQRVDRELLPHLVDLLVTATGHVNPDQRVRLGPQPREVLDRDVGQLLACSKHPRADHPPPPCEPVLDAAGVPTGGPR